jgi:hypothetical protein
MVLLHLSVSKFYLSCFLLLRLTYLPEPIYQFVPLESTVLLFLLLLLLLLLYYYYYY